MQDRPQQHCLLSVLPCAFPRSPADLFSAGRGECNCDGTCTCQFGFSGAACECLTCEGQPTECSGHGKCECDGTCTCDALWTSANPAKPVCDCSSAFLSLLFLLPVLPSPTRGLPEKLLRPRHVQVRYLRVRCWLVHPCRLLLH